LHLKEPSSARHLRPIGSLPLLSPWRAAEQKTQLIITPFSLPLAQIIPLWVAIGAGAAICAGFLAKYFAGHTEISFSKSMRATFDHQVGEMPESVCCARSHTTRETERA
jgi:hypothetical protein